MTVKPLRVNIQIREYLGNMKYGKSHSITLYSLTVEEVYDKVVAVFKEENSK